MASLTCEVIHIIIIIKKDQVNIFEIVLLSLPQTRTK